MSRVFHLAFCIVAIVGLARADEPLPILGIAHVAFQSADLAASKAFYSDVLGYEVAFTQTNPAATIFKINDDQFVKLVAVPGPTADDRLVEIALQVSNVAKTHALLRERELEPAPIVRRADGTRATTVRDPDGHLIAFVEYTSDSEQMRLRGGQLGAKRVSQRIWHTGVTVADEGAARAFYETKLGGVEFWRGGPEGQPTSWVNVRLPGERGDYLEYMLHSEPPNRARLGTMQHICLEVPDIHAGCHSLLANGLPPDDKRRPQIGRNQHWLFNLYDPDGTRCELMEAKAVSAVRAANSTTPK